MTLSPDPIQAQLIAARRNQILDAAAKVFAEKGFHPTTIKDIAAVGWNHESFLTFSSHRGMRRFFYCRFILNERLDAYVGRNARCS